MSLRRILVSTLFAIQICKSWSICPNSTSNNVTCPRRMHHVASIFCYKRMKPDYIGKQKSMCEARGGFLLSVYTLPLFYSNGPLHCHGLADGPYFFDLTRSSFGNWTSLNGGFAYSFREFLTFNKYDCWDGAILGWYPYEVSDERPYGLLKCFDNSFRFDAICSNIPGPLPTTVKICEGGSKVINCGEQKIYIFDGYFGRKSNTLCPFSNPAAMANTTCAEDRTQSLINLCQGRNTCTVSSGRLVADPCPGTYKYLELNYSCV